MAYGALRYHLFSASSQVNTVFLRTHGYGLRPSIFGKFVRLIWAGFFTSWFAVFDGLYIRLPSHTQSALRVHDLLTLPRHHVTSSTSD